MSEFGAAAPLDRSKGLTPPRRSASGGSAHLTAGIPNAKYFVCSSDHSEGSEATDVGEGLAALGLEFGEGCWPEMLLRNYEVGAVIGRGASSDVFAATAIETGESVAVKRVLKRRSCVSERATRRLRDEVRVLSTLEHPHIVHMREVFETPTELYIVMERAMGGELFDRIVASGTFSEEEAATVMFQLLSALAETHGRGMIHRDIKPENLLLTTADGWELKLSDFGLVKTLDDVEDEELARAPEQRRTKKAASWIASPRSAQRIIAEANAVVNKTLAAEEEALVVEYQKTAGGSAAVVVVTPDASPPVMMMDLETEVSSTAPPPPVLPALPPSPRMMMMMMMPRPPPILTTPMAAAAAAAATTTPLPKEAPAATRRNSHPNLGGRRMDSVEISERFGNARTHTLCGSPYYMAPEVCSRERYGPSVDVWSAGVVLYILLTGSPPWDRPPAFGSATPLDFDGELACVSEAAIDLIVKMLKPQPADRLTAREALEHPWIIQRRLRSLPDDLPEEEVIIPPPPASGLSPRHGPLLRAFVEKRKRTNLDQPPGGAGGGIIVGSPANYNNARISGQANNVYGFDFLRGSLETCVRIKKGRLHSIVKETVGGLAARISRESKHPAATNGPNTKGRTNAVSPPTPDADYPTFSSSSSSSSDDDEDLFGHDRTSFHFGANHLEGTETPPYQPSPPFQFQPSPPFQFQPSPLPPPPPVNLGQKLSEDPLNLSFNSPNVPTRRCS